MLITYGSFCPALMFCFDYFVLLIIRAIKGANIKIGDKVYYECTYSKNLPFNWNATLVQLVPNSAGPQSGGVGGAPRPGPTGPPHGSTFEPHGKAPQGQLPPNQHNSQYSMHHNQSPQAPQQTQPPPHQPGNYAMPQHNPYQPSQGSNASSNSYYHSQSKPMSQPFPGQQYQPAYGGGVNSGHSQSALPQQQQQPKPVPQPPPPNQQPHQPHQAPPPFPDLAKVQQAVAAATQLAQQYYPNQGAPGSNVTGPPGGPNAHPGTHPPQSNQPGGGHGQPPAGSYGQIQYTSTPGSAFISAPQQFNSGPPGPPKQQQLPPGPQGPPPNRGGPPGGPPPGVGGPNGRWGDHDNRFDPRRPVGGPGPLGAPGGRDNGPPGGPSRFDGPPVGGRGPKSRFNDSDRFGTSIPIPPPPPPPQQQQPNQMQINEELPHSRFGPSPSQNDNFRPMSGRDEFGRDLRKDDSQVSQREGPPRGGPGPGFRGNVDKERDSFRDRTDSRDRVADRDKDSDTTVTSQDNRGQGGGNRDKDHHPRGGGRNDRRRDRGRGRGGGGGGGGGVGGGVGGATDKKRSISPASVASSSGGIRSDSSRNPLPGTSKRRYEPCNIPKNMILRNRYSANELKSRVSSSVHIPSDLKEVLYNVDADLDLLDIPKPLLYKILSVDKEKESKSKESKDKESKDKIENKISTPSKSTEIKRSAEETKASVEVKKEPESNDSQSSTTIIIEQSSQPSQEKESQKTQESQVVTLQESAEQEKEEIEPKDMEIDEESVSGENNTSLIETNVPLESVSQTKSVTETSQNKSFAEQNKSQISESHKFNVKVLLISLPTLAEIYEKLFGSDFDNTSSSKNRVTHFNKLFSLLVSRNSDNGYSLIGGKWIPEKDGILPGGGEDSPNLIATAIRVVHEQTGLNLSACRQWKVFSTFIYNRDTQLDPSNGSYEITKIYFPDIWSSLDAIYAPLDGTKVEEKMENVEVKKEIKHDGEITVNVVESVTESVPESIADESVVIESVQETKESLPQTEPIEEEEKSTERSVIPSNDVSNNESIINDNIEEESQQSSEPEDTPSKEYLEGILESINDMKVADLKSELEKLNQKIDGRPRKDQLAQRLRDYVNEQLEIINSKAVAKQQQKQNTSLNSNDGEKEEEMQQQEQEETSLLESTEATIEQTQEITQTQQNGPAIEDETNKLISNEASKRKLENGDIKTAEAESEPKKIKIELPSASTTSTTIEKESTEKISISATGSNIKVKGHHLSLLNLSNALNPHRFDQFELIIAAELIRDSLVVHFARYILSTLIHNYHSLKSVSTNSSLPTDKHRVIAVNYVHLAFSYFDKGHCGHMSTDDLAALLNSTGYTLSRKVLASLATAAGGDRVQYREYQPPNVLVDRVFHYPSISSSTSTSSSSTTVNANDADGLMIVERNSIQYNVDNLIKQSEIDQKAKVRLNEELTSSNGKIGLLEQTIVELETKQKKMSTATGRQNDELCAVKRERDQLKIKYEQLRKTLEKTLASLGEALKQNQPFSGVNSSPLPVSSSTLANSFEIISTQVNESSL